MTSKEILVATALMCVAVPAFAAAPAKSCPGGDGHFDTYNPDNAVNMLGALTSYLDNRDKGEPLIEPVRKEVSEARSRVATAYERVYRDHPRCVPPGSNIDRVIDITMEWKKMNPPAMDACSADVVVAALHDAWGCGAKP